MILWNRILEVGRLSRYHFKRKDLKTPFQKKTNVVCFSNQSDETHEQKKERIKNYTSISQLDPELQSIIHGGLLADASIDNQAGKVTGRLAYHYSGKNLAYPTFIHSKLSDGGLCKPDPLVVKQTYDKRYEKYYSNARFTSYSFPFLDDLHKRHYRPTTELEKSLLSGENRTSHYVRIVPKDIGDHLTPLALAIWFCDNGGFHIIAGTVHIGTDDYTLEEVQLLADVLKKRFGLEWTISKTGGVKKTGQIQYKLSLSRRQVPALRKIIESHMIPSMLYKLGLDENGVPFPLKKAASRRKPSSSKTEEKKKEKKTKTKNKDKEKP